MDRARIGCIPSRAISGGLSAANGIRIMLKRARASLGIHHLSGKKDISYAEDEFIVCTLVRNGSAYLPSFLEHYRRLGAVHFIFLDNASEDGLADLVANDNDVSVFQTALSYKKYKFQLKRYLARRFARGRWMLLVDIDELFDFPYSSLIRFADLIRYLEANRYTAVTAFMLDMFSQFPVGQANHGWPPDLKNDFPYYDVSAVTRKPVQQKSNQLSNPAIKKLYGGIRAKVFDAKPALTKYPLFKMSDGLKPIAKSAHSIGNARVADFSAVLLHYKFLDSFERTTEKIVAEGQYFKNSEEYKAYQRVIDQQTAVALFSEQSQQLGDVVQLVDDDFLQVTPEYLNFVRECQAVGA